MKHTALLIITLFLGMQSNCNPQTKNTANIEKNTNKAKKAEIKKDKKKENENKLKILASGSYSGVEEPFIFLARDEKSMQQLSRLLNNIKIKENVDFEKNIVVAAFAGIQNTGGYSVGFDESNGKVSVKLNSPPKDVMVTQVLTQPFSVALVPLVKGKNLNLEVSDLWKNKTRNYQVESGSFEFSGGIAGVRKQFETEGSIQIYRLDDFVTLILNLKGKEKESDRKLYDIISGEIENNSLIFEEINNGNFIDNPHPPLRFEAEFSVDKLLIKLNAVDENSPIRDGFAGGGTLEAVKIN